MLMEFKSILLSCFFALLMGFLSSSEAYKFFVGGKDGWVLTPSESYNHWAERMRFQVNDTLYFKYKKGSDSVLIVSKDDYFSCNIKNPVKSLADGDSTVTFDHSGPYFFISGNGDNCNKGQKLVVVVMAVRNKTHHRHAPPSPSPAASPTPASPPTVSPPVESPKSSAPVQPPTSSDTPSDLDAPSPAPLNSGSSCLGFSVGSVLGYSISTSVVFGSIFGLV
ncbi:Early nodulin-like protein [Melia azedarach]|uniref:Early nodulin-like protein n=1 Tax=Melia azedarach TaxID=155640 RepID=A0ACC1Z235_MELAZ|nr:Early nodulin-like protein [Melia azedarach]